MSLGPDNIRVVHEGGQTREIFEIRRTAEGIFLSFKLEIHPRFDTSQVYDQWWDNLYEWQGKFQCGCKLDLLSISHDDIEEWFDYIKRTGDPKPRVIPQLQRRESCLLAATIVGSRRGIGSYTLLLLVIMGMLSLEFSQYQWFRKQTFLLAWPFVEFISSLEFGKAWGADNIFITITNAIVDEKRHYSANLNDRLKGIFFTIISLPIVLPLGAIEIAQNPV